LRSRSSTNIWKIIISEKTWNLLLIITKILKTWFVSVIPSWLKFEC
jgi:hypothetical protein